MHRPINPDSLARASGFSHGILCQPGAVLFVAGQIGWNAEGKLVSTDFVGQFEQALANVLTVVREAGGPPESLARLTMYVTDKTLYVAETRRIGEVYRRLVGKHFPAMALIEVKGLLEEGALVELEATAVIP